MPPVASRAGPSCPADPGRTAGAPAPSTITSATPATARYGLHPVMSTPSRRPAAGSVRFLAGHAPMGQHVLLARLVHPSRSAELEDVGADDDTMSNRVRALVGVDGAVGLPCNEP